MNKFLWQLSLFIMLSFGKTAQCQIVINEICVINDDVLADLDGDKSDWIELYNASSFTENLSDYALYSKKQRINYSLPNVNLGPEEFLIIFISGKNKSTPQIHTNFKIIITDTIQLLHHQIVANEIGVLDLAVDHSYGSVEDGPGDYEIFSSPTPGASNEYSPHFMAYTPTTNFNIEGGFYANTQILELSNAQSNSIIYYTTDGSIPYFNSPIYTAPILINSNKIIKSYSQIPGMPPSKIITKSYFINETVNLPVVSISTDSVLLFDTVSGLLEKGPNANALPPYYGANFWSDNQIKVHVQVYDKHKKEQINQFCEMQIHGGSVNRSQAMKSFRMLSKKKFEKDRFYAQLLSDKPAQAYRKFVLRNGSSDFLKSQLREGLIHTSIIKNTNVDANGYEPCLVFINGKYYGMMEIREKIDEYYVEQNHRISHNNVDVLADTNLIDIGDWQAFDSIYSYVLHNDLKETTHFNYVAERIDLKNMADYFFIETYFDNNDWPSSNLRLWSQRSPRGKFRYIAFDLDASLGTYSWSPYTLNMLHESLNYFTTIVPVKHCIIFKKLLENDEFKNYFINRYADLFNSTFSATYLNNMLDTLGNTVKPEINRHFITWGKQFSDWENEINYVIKPYIIQRHNLSKQDVLKEFALPAFHHIKINTFPEGAFKQLNINTITVNQNNFEGYYFESVPISFKINAAKGYVFSHWQQSNGNKFFSDSITVNMNDSSQFTAVYFLESEKSPVVVYPNPTQKSNLYVRLGDDIKSLKSVSIFNTLGQRLYNTSQPKIMGEYTIELETQQLKQGMYYITIDFNEHSEVVKFMVL